MYQPAELDTVEEFAAGEGMEDEGEPVMAATVTELPSKDLDGLWNRCVLLDRQCSPWLTESYPVLFMATTPRPDFSTTFTAQSSSPTQMSTLTSFHGTELFFCTGRQGQARRVCAEHWHRSCPFDCQVATPPDALSKSIRTRFSPNGSQSRASWSSGCSRW